MKGHVKYAQQDDDINYMVLGLRVLEEYGKDFRPQDMATTWLENIPYNWTWSAEHSRYMLMAGRGIPDDGEEWEEMTSFLNDGEEVIGAMIRGDTFGLVNPGRPELAAEMAWRDGSITHKKTGLYAEMWVAATIAAAFTTFDPVEAIKIGIEHLPKNARYTEALRQALEISLGDEDWMVAYEEINARWGHLGHAGTFNESAAIINALVHSVGKDGLVDYEKVICRTVMHGWDTDCSAATAGCIAGVLCGFHNIPDKWLAPLNNTYYTCVATDIDTQIDKLAERVYQMSRIIHP
jgi:ADP-ribosylglycohydrolase